MSSPPAEAPAAPAPQLRRTLVLIGIMGAGKTSVGQVLARRLGAAFTDSDQEIERAAGLTIPEIFARFGEAYFRAGEMRVIDRLLAGPPLVLATGGGAFVQPGTRSLILARGVSVWLRASLEVIWDRVKGKTGRPLLATPDPRGTLAALIAARYPVYAAADVTVDSLPGERHEQAAERILAALRARDAAVPAARRALAEEP
jgi:shikimate kinase